MISRSICLSRSDPSMYASRLGPLIYIADQVLLITGPVFNLNLLDFVELLELSREAGIGLSIQCAVLLYYVLDVREFHPAVSFLEGFACFCYLHFCLAQGIVCGNTRVPNAECQNERGLTRKGEVILSDPHIEINQ